MSAAGIASRRKAEDLILEGLVTVNGVPAKIGQSADPEKDKILIEGKPIPKTRKIYIALNKPKGYVTTSEDQFAQKIVTDLVRDKVYPVGRLDKDSEGLLIMTNDGEFANRVMHPRYNIEKTYLCTLETPLAKEELDRINRGIKIEGRLVEARARFLSKDRILVEVSLHEGRHKIVKRLIRAGGCYVRSLKRTRIGPIFLGNLKSGGTRPQNRQRIQRSNKNPIPN